MATLAERIAATTQLAPGPVNAALALFDDGATVPFVARYRKEHTGGLDEVELRAIAQAQSQLKELDARRDTILTALTKQGQLSSGLREALEVASTRAELDDLYAPFKQRKKTRGDKARAAGLQPLADRILAQGGGHPQHDAKAFVRGSIASVDDALAGARDIIAEDLAVDARRRSLVRDLTRRHGMVSTAVKRGADASGKYEAYVDVQERASHIPSHRYLAICRAEAEGILSVKLRPDVDRTAEEVLRTVRIRRGSPWAAELQAAVEDATKRLLVPVAERAVRAELKTLADDEAIDVFQRNLEAVLLSAPFGARPVIGVDPGIRTGCKCAVV
ncbi:MAG: hypothetical protein ACI9K2_007634, partial [Myxococcota bacterium]